MLNSWGSLIRSEEAVMVLQRSKSINDMRSSYFSVNGLLLPNVGEFLTREGLDISKLSLSYSSGDLVVAYTFWGGYSLSFCLTSYPNNCGVMVVSGISGAHQHFQKELLILLKAFAKLFSYSCLSYTTTTNQSELNETLKKMGFNYLKGSEFTNINSGNVVGFWCLNLN